MQRRLPREEASRAGVGTESAEPDAEHPVTRTEIMETRMMAVPARDIFIILLS
jgi:hypothetical protein